MGRKRLRRVTMFGHTVHVRYKRGLTDGDGNQVLGMACFGSNEVLINGSIPSEDLEKQTVWHELVHYILYMLGEHEMNEDERLVDLFGQLLYQVEKSGRSS